MIYLALLFAIGVIVFFERRLPKAFDLFLYGIFFVFLVALSGFRYKVGGDTYNYILLHPYLPGLSDSFDIDSSKLQYSWLLLSAIAKEFSEEFFVVQFIHAIIVNASVFIFVARYSKFKFLVLFFYTFAVYPYYNFEIMRESLAVACFLFAIPYFLRMAWVHYYLLCILAVSFHLSAVILFLIPFFRFKISFIKSGILFVIFAILSYVEFNFARFIVYSSSFYASVDQYSSYSLNIFGFILVFYSTIIFYQMLCFFSDRYSISKILRPVLLPAIIIATFIPFYSIFFRFLNYFSIPVIIISVDFLCSSFRFKYKYIINLIIISNLVFIPLYRYSSDTSDLVSDTRWIHRWYPYTSIFDDDSDSVRDQLIQQNVGR